MKLLIVSFVDDNFGDNLIKICFESLLKTVLKNLQLAENEYEINKMPLKNIDKGLVVGSDVIFFAGGGLFGLSYLNFFEYLDEITKLADEHNIPVVFSSIGINNMDATAENEELLKTILKRKCIASVSVRENLNLFQKYAEGCGFEIEKVCDPAVWTKYVYDIDPQKKSDVIGINVVRGGLFRDNKKSWGMTDEFKYLFELKHLLDEIHLDYVFYTNGSVLDNNTLRYFAREYNIPKHQVVYPHTTKDLVDTVSGFRAVVTFRMHSSIIAYSFGIPSVALVWNEKIPFFYQNINHPDWAFEFGRWDGKTVFQKLEPLLGAGKSFEPDRDYLMSVYLYLYKTLFNLLEKNREIASDGIYDFDTVTKVLAENAQSIDEEVFDLRFKMEKAEKQYLARFTDLKKKEKEISGFQKERAKTQKILEEKQKKIEELNARLKKQEMQIEKQEAELHTLNQMLSVRVVKYIKRKTGRK